MNASTPSQCRDLTYLGPFPFNIVINFAKKQRFVCGWEFWIDKEFPLLQSIFPQGVKLLPFEGCGDLNWHIHCSVSTTKLYAEIYQNIQGIITIE